VYLSCCFQGLKSEKFYCNDKIDNDGDGLVDCADPACFDNQGCILKRLNPYCANNKVCKEKGLKDLCCPTADGKYLDCCKQGLPRETGFCSDGACVWIVMCGWQDGRFDSDCIGSPSVRKGTSHKPPDSR
jgi:hypothetical protein